MSLFACQPQIRKVSLVRVSRDFDMASNEEAVREERLLYLQLQDLGLERRDEIITSETEANSFFLEDDQLQSRRRNNRDGTIESKAIKGKEDVLSAWNSEFRLPPCLHVLTRTSRLDYAEG